MANVSKVMSNYLEITSNKRTFRLLSLLLFWLHNWPRQLSITVILYRLRNANFVSTPDSRFASCQSVRSDSRLTVSADMARRALVCNAAITPVETPRALRATVYERDQLFLLGALTLFKWNDFEAVEADEKFSNLLAVLTAHLWLPDLGFNSREYADQLSLAWQKTECNDRRLVALVIFVNLRSIQGCLVPLPGRKPKLIGFGNRRVSFDTWKAIMLWLTDQGSYVLPGSDSAKVAPFAPWHQLPFLNNYTLIAPLHPIQFQIWSVYEKCSSV